MKGDEHLPEPNPEHFPARFKNQSGLDLKIVCGPLLRMWSMDKDTWEGGVGYVFADEYSKYGNLPQLELSQENKDPVSIRAFKYYSTLGYSFFRYDIKITKTETSQVVSYQLPGLHEPYKFHVPGFETDGNFMFYSCNGFSLGVDTSQFAGSLWVDVLRKHEEKPFHCMLGGGDQLYCDSITKLLPVFKKWTVKNLSKKGFRYQPNFHELDTIEHFYLRQYVDWFGRGYWKGTNGETNQTFWPEAAAQIPMLNIYDDHDVLDGYGTYKDKTQLTPMMNAVGKYGHIFYLVFQHLISPDTESNDPKARDPSFILSSEKGPYMDFYSRSIFTRIGKFTSFAGLDCRTERKNNVVIAKNTYDIIFRRFEEEFAKGGTRHLLLMLGVPIAYPRMVWAERLMRSFIARPLRYLSRKKILLKGFANDFDGEVELLDDLEDHWCATHHKKERNEFILRLQALSKKFSVRITILTGDVHLCGVGRFKTNEREEKLALENDFRYMLSPVSSAITNTPPPNTLADFMNKRNHNHYLDKTVERMIDVFMEDVDGKKRNNNCLLPRRNFCQLVEHANGSLDMTLFVEKDSHDEKAETQPYKLNIIDLKVL